MQHFVQGEAVFVIPLRQEGTVLSLPDVGGKVEVQVGPARILVDAADLEAVDKNQDKTGTGNITQVVRTRSEYSA